MKYQKEFELMKQAAAQNANNSLKAKQLHQNQFYGET